MNIRLKKSELTFKEAYEFVNNVVDACFITKDGIDVDYTPLNKIPSIQANFCELYTDIEFLQTEDEEGKEIEGSFEKNFSTYMNVEINANGLVTSDGSLLNYFQFKGLLEAIDEQIEFRKQKLIHNQKSSMDEMFEKATELLEVLNVKAQELDTKKLEKIFKKLNPNEVVKAYQKSNIGDGIRDKAIEDLKKENIELKNQISARNVKA